MELPPTLKPVPLESTTTTGAEALGSCSLRAAFDASPTHRGVVLRGPGARLGSICHRVLEATAHGVFDRVASSLSSSFDQVWQRFTKEEELAVKQSPLERHFGLADRWPYYALKRAYALRQVERMVGARRTAGVSAPGVGTWRSATTNYQRGERQYAGFNGCLRGRADHVHEGEDRIEIVDYKTGAIFDGADGPGPAIKPEYRRQLLLYAALHWNETDRWPTTATLVSLRGETASIDVVPQEALALVEETLGCLDAYNGAVRSGAQHEALASPSASVCAQCPYKAMCPAFWNAVDESWSDGRAVHLSGVVGAIEDLGNNGWVLDIEGQKGTLPRQHYRLRGITKHRFPDRDGLIPMVEVRIISARSVDPAEPRDLVPTDYTELWWVPRRRHAPCQAEQSSRTL